MGRLLATVVLAALLLVQACVASADAVSGQSAEQRAASGRSLKELLYGSTPLGGGELGWELDLYYSNLSLNLPLTSQPIPVVENADELEIYGKLFVDALIPRFLLLEAAVMPLPLAGAAVREYAGDFYREMRIGRNQNLVSWLTAGFDEPWAVSLFLGDIVSFHRPGEERLSSNKGYMGVMASYSNQHLMNSRMIRDHSCELEWKLKGERHFRNERLDWSFRIGAKLHDHPHIADSAYIGLRRSNLDFIGTPLDLLKNSTLDMRWDIALKTGTLIRQEYVVGSKFPVKGWGMAFRLDLGVIWEDPTRYTGSLRERDAGNFTFVLRPNLVF